MVVAPLVQLMISKLILMPLLNPYILIEFVVVDVVVQLVVFSLLSLLLLCKFSCLSLLFSSLLSCNSFSSVDVVDPFLLFTLEMPIPDVVPLDSKMLLERCLRCKGLSPVVHEVVVVEEFCRRIVVGAVAKDELNLLLKNVAEIVVEGACV